MRVKVSVYFPSGIACDGAEVDATLRALPPRSGSARTGADGSCICNLDSSRILGAVVTVDFRASVADARGVTWTASSNARWRLAYVRPGTPPPVREVVLNLTRVPRQVAFSLDAHTFAEIRSSDGGVLILEDWEELLGSLRASLPSAAAGLVGKILEGSIKVRARTDGWWDSAWDRMTVGDLVVAPAVKAKLVERLGLGGWDRLRASGVWLRRVGVHHLSEPISIDEAVAAARVLTDFLPRWWSASVTGGGEGA